MPKVKVNPALAVVAYFESAPLEEAKLTAEFVKATIKKREKHENGEVGAADPPLAKRKRRQVNGGVQGELPPV